MKILATSDLHNTNLDTLLPFATNCDCMIIAGDILPSGCYGHNNQSAKPYLEGPFRSWCEKIAKPIFLIAGNHDLYLVDENHKIAWARNVVYLRDSAVTYNGLKIYGTPWCHWHDANKHNKRVGLFEVSNETLRGKFSKIPAGIDVLILHENPHLHHAERGKFGLKKFSKGNRVIRKYIENVRPRLVLCGHLHENDHKLFELYPSVHVCSVSRCISKDDHATVQPPVLLEINQTGPVCDMGLSK